MCVFFEGYFQPQILCVWAERCLWTQSKHHSNKGNVSLIGALAHLHSFTNFLGQRRRSVERRNKLNRALGPIVDNEKHQQTLITFLNLSHLHLWTACLNSICPNMSGCTAIHFIGWSLCEYSCVTHSCECCVGALLDSGGELNPKSLFLGALWERAFIIGGLVSILNYTPAHLASLSAASTCR